MVGVGRRISENLIQQNIKVVIAEENREIVEKLRLQGIAAVSGEATEPNVLIQAHIQHARLLVISPMDILDIHRIVDISKQLNPEIQVLVCAESKEEAGGDSGGKPGPLEHADGSGRSGCRTLVLVSSTSVMRPADTLARGIIIVIITAIITDMRICIM